MSTNNPAAIQVLPADSEDWLVGGNAYWRNQTNLWCELTLDPSTAAPRINLNFRSNFNPGTEREYATKDASFLVTECESVNCAMTMTDTEKKHDTTWKPYTDSWISPGRAFSYIVITIKGLPELDLTSEDIQKASDANRKMMRALKSTKDTVEILMVWEVKDFVKRGTIQDWVRRCKSVQEARDVEVEKKKKRKVERDEDEGGKDVKRSRIENEESKAPKKRTVTSDVAEAEAEEGQGRKRSKVEDEESKEDGKQSGGEDGDDVEESEETLCRQDLAVKAPIQLSFEAQLLREELKVMAKLCSDLDDLDEDGLVDLAGDVKLQLNKVLGAVYKINMRG